MTVERQNADGTLEGLREQDYASMYRAGGYAGPAGSNQPSFEGGAVLSFNIAGGTDSGGGLLSWKNTLGYDVIVTAHWLDVTTAAAAACGVDFGQTASSGTTAASNMISNQDVHSATGTFNGGVLSVKVPNNTWITGSTHGGGASAGLVARANFAFTRAPAAGGK
jgi:hypothetical protein